MNKHLNIIAHGKVQGVGFRDYVKSTAEELGVTGFVKNEEDGTVYIEAEADRDTLSELLGAIEKGPDTAEVEKVDKFQKGLQHFSGFEIKQ